RALGPASPELGRGVGLRPLPAAAVRGRGRLTPNELLGFLRTNRLAVEASVAASGAPQAALVGFAVTDEFELVFDTVDTTRKVPNLRGDPRVALVIGWADERTAQYEGVADEPSGHELERLKAVYFAAFPDGPSRLAWPGLTY